MYQKQAICQQVELLPIDSPCQHSMSIYTQCSKCKSSTFHSVGAGNKNNNSRASGRCQVCKNHKYIARSEFDTAIAQITGGQDSV